jgi:hypothetical protein
VPPHEPTSPSAPPAQQTAGEGAGVVDWHRTGRRLRRQLVVILALVVVAWVVVGVRDGAVQLRVLGELAGIGVLVAVAAEIVVVGGAAVRGLVRAGDRGDRLSSGDVSLLPPQVTRRLRGRR